MSAREWKPGDVAVCDVRGAACVMLRGEGNHREARWYDRFGQLRPDHEWMDGREIRPLVVIDPEDREQVERLIDGYVDVMQNDERSGSKSGAVRKMQAALRSLIEPPKPEEPMGLGAVVEDDAGRRWVLYTSVESTAPWCDGSTSVEWDDIAAVKVLSEGVIP